MGPLAGIRIVEIAGIGPVPYCAMMLADLGADIVRIDRPGAGAMTVDIPPAADVVNRNRRSVAIDLKKPGAADVVLRMIDSADGLLEGMRPGVMERLGLGPVRCLARRPELVYGRMTGWGQEGPLAATAGHDINYIALSGALGAMGPADSAPVPPLNLVGDYGGGAMYLAVGMLAGLIAARNTGKGQVVDAAMVDGATQLMSMFFALRTAGHWSGGRGENLLDGGAPYYGTYETGDGRYVAVGAIEPKFYAALLAGLGMKEDDLPPQNDTGRWPEIRATFAALFKQRTRDEWTEVFAGSDACVSPVLDLDEVAEFASNRARDVMVDVGGMMQPAPAPRFAETRPGRPRAAVASGADTRRVLDDAGFSRSEVEALIASGVVHEAAA
jgi:alpha-methylacyl-CoA racemase